MIGLAATAGGGGWSGELTAHLHLTKKGALPDAASCGCGSGLADGDWTTGDRHKAGLQAAPLRDLAMSVLLARMMWRIIPLQSRQTVMSGPRSCSSWGELALCWKVRERRSGGRRRPPPGGLHTEARCRSLATGGGGYTVTLSRALNVAPGGLLSVGDDGAEPLANWKAAGNGE